jgi:hypothetical protein
MTCTWLGCTNEATHPQIAKDKEQWANLCKSHDGILDLALQRGPKFMIGAWIMAQGGPVKAADRMTKGTAVL